MGWKSVVLAVGVVVAAMLLKVLYDGNELTTLRFHGEANCDLKLARTGAIKDTGFEDIALHPSTHLAFLSPDERSGCFEHYAMHQCDAPVSTITVFDMKKEQFVPSRIEGYPFPHFHPHGLSLHVASSKDQPDKLFVVNHRSNRWLSAVVESVTVFGIGKDSDGTVVLTFLDDVAHQLMTGINDVVTITDKSFFVSNWKHYRPDVSPVMAVLQDFGQLPWMNVLYCEADEEGRWDCREAAKGLRVANGLELSPDGNLLYAVESVGKKVGVYHRSEDNFLTLSHYLHTPSMCDNAFVEPQSGTLFSACHPKMIAFLRHFHNPSVPAPSQVIAWDTPQDATSEGVSIFLSDGAGANKLPASTGVAYWNKKMIIGGIHSRGLLLCKNVQLPGSTASDD